MATFVLIPTSTTEEFPEFVKNKFGNLALPLPNGDWLVSYIGTSKQLADETGISDGKFGSVLVLNFDGYWGRSTKDVWEWIAEHGSK
ncbi:hypothetical protein J2X32_003158 [Rheinheimera pacifica]|uniref:hypothetical protein n=1 Tax=Rheinheimera pacifica TaxID=173990 RepID=UPI0028559507|nr:hypothetical protein [Rheinheimera pacifica]MDR6984514.1 hypothetical protein [Rheinheimera pacifica]